MKFKLSLRFEAKDLKSRIPTEYYQFLDVFGKQMAGVLPPHHTRNDAIDLKDRTDTPWNLVDTLSTMELNALCEYVDELLRRAKIRTSQLLAGPLILFIPTDHGNGQRLCIDYGGLYKITILTDTC
jgi:hypothetical protein